MQLNDRGVKSDFQLKTTFPQATLPEQGKTVKEAGLTPSAQVMVSLDKGDEESSSEEED